MKRLVHSPFFCGFISCLILLSTFSLVARANDEIFPPSPAAESTISFDGKGFIIRGHREFVASGSIHYARVPRELWRDRLMKLKRAGFNTVQTYAFWNYHETQQGKFDFTTGEHDLGAFLQTAQDVGLYAIVRMGPYCCAEWDSGGYPIWLRSDPNLKVRADDPAFMDAVDKFWDQLIPIVAAHQIHRGGNVILVQLENEDPQGWGTDLPNSYFVHLQKKAVELGIEVPYFFSGLHHGTDPANDTPWDIYHRHSPWLSTETWIRWFDKYGDSPPDDLATYQRHVWNLVADCANGFNLYMFHGGTNFDYWNSIDASASYDYGAMLGQAGDLRNLYYGVKRASTFATSFPNILENCENSLDAGFASGPTVTTGQPPKTGSSVIPFVRRSPDGTVVFVRNTQKTPEVATLQTKQTLNLDSLEVAALLVDTPLAPGLRVKLAAARTLGLATHGATTTWIVYGKPEEKGHLDLDLDQDAPISSQPPSSPFQINGSDAKHPSIDITFSEKGPAELLFTTGGQTLRILAETPAWTNRTWIVGERGAQTVVIGPDYVGDFAEANGKARFTVARPFGHAPLADVVLYGEDARARHVAVNDPVPADVDTAPALGPWMAARADAPAASDFSDAAWMGSAQPLPLGADGDVTAYGWYRASFESPTGGQGKLNGTFLNDAIVFLNGKLVGDTSGKGGISLDVPSGSNTLAIFSAFKGRQDAYNYVDKPIAALDPKGISGPVTVTLGGQSIPVASWKLHGGLGVDMAALAWDAAPTANLGRPTFFRTEFNAQAPKATGPCPIFRVTTGGLTRGSIWLNGHNLGRYPEGLKIDGLYLPECWLKDGANSLVIFDEEGHVPTGAVHLWCERAASREVFEVQE